MYLKTPSPQWQARPGFSGLGSLRRRRRGLHGNATAAGDVAAFKLRYAGDPAYIAQVLQTQQPSGLLAPPYIAPLVPGNGATGIATDGTGSTTTMPPATPGSGWWQTLHHGPIATPINSTTNTGAGSTAAQVSGSPVPVGYPTSQIYVAPGGVFWEFNGSTWQSVGTPYNVSSGSTPASTTSATGAQASPVPAGYPTNLLYTYTDGSVWQYSASAGGWQEIQGPSSTTSALTAAGAPASGAVTVMPADTGYQSILDWLGTSTLISGVPNWIIAAGAGFAAIKLMNPGKGR